MDWKRTHQELPKEYEPVAAWYEDHGLFISHLVKGVWKCQIPVLNEEGKQYSLEMERPPIRWLRIPYQ